MRPKSFDGLMAVLVVAAASCAASPEELRLRVEPSALKASAAVPATSHGEGEEEEGADKASRRARFPASTEASELGVLRVRSDDEDEGPDFLPLYSRWFAPGNPVYLGDTPIEPAPYPEVNRTSTWWNSYRQHKLKGDFPIFGTKDIFFNVIATNRFTVLRRNIPTPTGITGPGPITPSFFGDGGQTATNMDTAVTFEIFKGQQGFKPVQWRIRATPVFNLNSLYVNEVGVVKIDVGAGEERHEQDLSLQEALFEYHLYDWTDRYDFISSEFGVLPFRSDFRGFVFDDVNLGVRILGNADDNKVQYNLVYFDMLDKDTNSLLNKTDSREQKVWIANVYKQDWPVLGYTSSLSFHYNDDTRGTHFDDNGFLVSPAPVGFAGQNEVESYYLGYAGEGHFDRFNVTTAVYQALGEDTNNPFAGRDVDINAQFAALELSLDFDWWRVRLYGMYQSGDSNARDGDARGFDSILDAPNFAGGEFSFFNRETIRLGGVGLTNPLSHLVDLQSSKFEGKSNFVNPGLNLVGLAYDADITPTLRTQIGVNYLRFDHSDVLQTFLELPNIEEEIGYEIFSGTQWRPWLTQNVVLQLGASALIPGDGFERIYQSDETVYNLFLTTILTW